MSVPHSVSVKDDMLLNNRYQLLNALGSGGYATVYRALDCNTGRNVAVKCIKRTPKNLDLVNKEVQLTKAVPHPHIVQVFDVIHEGGNIYIVMEHLKKTLFDALSRGPFDDEELFTVFHQLVSAVQALHRAGICHRDIKLENVMLDDEDNVKLIDFGLASHKFACSSRCGSKHYMAPELLSPVEDLYDGSKSDAWSLGCVLYCMLTRRMPFLNDTESDVVHKILTKDITVPQTIDAATADLLRALINKDVSKRLSVRSINNHKFWTARCHLYALPINGVESLFDEDDYDTSRCGSSSTLSSSTASSALSSSSLCERSGDEASSLPSLKSIGILPSKAKSWKKIVTRKIKRALQS